MTTINTTPLYKNPFFSPLRQATDWQQLLAKPELHWKTGYSARSLAYSWAEAQGFPREVRALLETATIPALQDLEFLLGIPEHEVPLSGGARPSQNDIFVLAKARDGLVSIAVEGKVAEAFDKPVDQRFANPSPGETSRLNFLLDLLQLERSAVGPVGYQLLHRTASALLEARRFGARHAIMLIHSFSQQLAHFDDYTRFASLYGVQAQPNQLYRAKDFGDVSLYLGWSVGDAEYLQR